MENYEQIELVETCGACPEQYDAYFKGENVGYLRLRHGFFRAEYKGKTVYSANPVGDGIFEPEERDKYLANARRAIYEEMTTND